MKALKRLVLAHSRPQVDTSRDSSQFIYHHHLPASLSPFSPRKSWHHFENRFIVTLAQSSLCCHERNVMKCRQTNSHSPVLLFTQQIDLLHKTQLHHSGNSVFLKFLLFSFCHRHSCDTVNPNVRFP